MKEHMINKMVKATFWQKMNICFALLFVIFLSTNVSNRSFANDEVGESGNHVLTEEQKFCYVSDIPYVEDQSSVAWREISLDKTPDDTALSMRVEGANYTFEKGIFAHATSTVVYDLEDYSEYDYFTAYVGLNTTSTRGDGVAFDISTSQDGITWESKIGDQPIDQTPGKNATFVKIDIRNARFLKLYADDKAANASDHAVYADAKLIKEGYDDSNGIKTIEEYDQILKNYEGQEITGDYELTLLQRELVKRAGPYALKRFSGESEANRQMFSWLMNDVENIRLYIMGGTPEGGNYYNSLTQLSRLYDEYSSDFSNNECLNNKWYPDMTYGYLYKKMAMSIALTHSQRVGLWMQSGVTENQSDALRRYAIFKYMHKNDKLKVNDNIDYTPWFEALQVEEMRYIMNNSIDDEEILWLNEYVQQKVQQTGNTNWLTPHPHMAYVYPNYQNAVYYDEENKDYFNELFAVNGTGLFDLRYTIPGGKNNPTYDISITRGTTENKVYKVWMNFRNKFGTGAVCGGISKSGSNIRATHAIPATVIGQPGHAALLYYTKDAQGRGYWNIDNDVSGWTRSEKGERLLLNWGNANTNYARGSYQVVYMALAQEALNDYENFEKCEKLVMLANTYTDDLAKQEETYRAALEIQPINLDAWLGLINVYNASENKTENEYFDLAKELAENLKYFPLPMQQLTNLIKPHLTSIENQYRFTLLQTRILTEGTGVPNNSADQYYVYQPSLTRLEANFLLGNLDKTIATFSFDGEDAGKIVLSSRFDGNGVRLDYCLTGKGENADWKDADWNEVAFTAEEEHKIQLTPQQIASITSENDIYVHIVGVNYDEENLYKIDITEQELPSNLFANDLENRVIGVNLSTQWRYTENDEWKSYSVVSPDLSGNKTVQVRQSATGTKLTSPASELYQFTEDNQPDTRNYIPVSHLTLNSVSTQATANQGAATNALDANYNTRWHSAWNGTDTQRFITIKLDNPVYLSAVEFVPAGGGNGRIVDGTIWGSMDGENWEVLTSRQGITYPTQANTIEQAKAFTQDFAIDTPKEVQYVKIVADRTNGNWFAARAFNLYQDMTKNPHPTAGIAYSTTEPTNGNVVARLVNPSTKITITNNGGNDTYVFTENGEFTFEFVDENGNTGSSVAKVSWIDKNGPTADVNYRLDADKKLLILLDNISEDVYLLDENNHKMNYVEVENGKISSITYLDNSGNVSKVAEVDENGIITKIIYKNTTGSVTSVESYVTTLTNGEVTNEEYFDAEGHSVTITDEAEKEILRGLKQAISNPLEQVLETSGNYKFRLLDKANNILCKSVKVDYIDNDTKILASDITYDITSTTNKDVVATINPYIIDTTGNKDVNVEITNNEGRNKYTFTENGKFTFEYKDDSDTEGYEVKEHVAEVDWIDKTTPTAEIRYSTQESTRNAVVATLSNESESITIVNNGGNRTYTFTENGEFTFEFVDKAGNKGTVKAIVTWIEKDADKPEGITSKIYKIEGGYISKISPETTVKKLKENVETEQDLVFLDKNGKQLGENDIVATGMTLKVGSTLQFTLIVTGDINGDGKVTITDFAKLKLHLIETKKLTGNELKAADINYNGDVTITDFALLKLVLTDVKKI